MLFMRENCFKNVDMYVRGSSINLTRLLKIQSASSFYKISRFTGILMALRCLEPKICALVIIIFRPANIIALKKLISQSKMKAIKSWWSSLFAKKKKTKQKLFITNGKKIEFCFMQLRVQLQIF